MKTRHFVSPAADDPTTPAPFISLNASVAAVPMSRPRPLLSGLAPSARAPSKLLHHSKAAQISRRQCISWSTHLEFFHEPLEPWAAGWSIDLRLVRFFLLKIQCPECGELVIWLVQFRLTSPKTWAQTAQAANTFRCGWVVRCTRWIWYEQKAVRV